MTALSKLSMTQLTDMKKTTFTPVLISALLTALPLSAMAAATDQTDWPRLQGPIKPDDRIEARVRRIVAGMTLEQKVGQMTQPEIKAITPEQVRQFYIGSVLNGGGSWPDGNKYAHVKDWVRLADQYYKASMQTDMKEPVPVVWGIDAIHGNSNVYGATLYPHNIGLGAAHDPALIRQIGSSVARAVRATGINWVFAPTVAVGKDSRWGRTYESFSSDPALVKDYAFAYVSGLQSTFENNRQVIATAKHFIGDGGTEAGIDQGITRVSEADLLRIHGQGYVGAMQAGVQTVMASFNSWVDTTDPAAPVDYGKMHGNRKLLNDILKDKMGFDGFVVSDWNAIGQIPGCTNASCAQAINAGVDMIMVPDEWQAFIRNTVEQVRSGQIAEARIDDAVSRIIRVKLRAGLFGKLPSASPVAAQTTAIEDRALARKAVRESLVLLKNERQSLPLKSGQRILVLGKSADNLANQTGGWTLTWQGAENRNRDFPNAESILAGILKKANPSSVVYSENGDNLVYKNFDVIVAVIGETPYAEGAGDIGPIDNLKHSQRYPEDLTLLKKVNGKGIPVVTLLVSGRPAYVNDLINLSDSFVLTWLPGSEGGGVADLLFQTADSGKRIDFRGRLPFDWPSRACPESGQASQFVRGYGLSYQSAQSIGHLPEDHYQQGCGSQLSLPLYVLNERPGIALNLRSGDQLQALGRDLNSEFTLPTIAARTTQINTQQDAKLISWTGAAAFSADASHPIGLSGALSGGVLQLDLMLHKKNQAPVYLSMGCGSACEGKRVDLGPVLANLPLQKRQTLQIPLSCLAQPGQRISQISQPFKIETGAGFTAAFANIQIVPGNALQPVHVQCAE